MGRWSCHLFNNPVSSSLFRKLFLLLCVCSITQIEALTGYSDKSVLLQLKNSLSDESGLLSSWSSNSSDHCSWFGILCDFNSRVISLYILGNGGGEGKKNSSAFSCSDFSIFPLYGLGIRRNCAGSRGKLSGRISPVISELSELRNLSLPFNGFVGEVPTEIWAMKSLEVLDLEGNSITGILPDKFSGLRNLRVLNLGFNSIQGGIPASLSSCFNLEILNLAGNQFNGTIPGFLSQLKGVYMSFNSFTGSIPSELGDDCGKLEHLDLSGNLLVQGIPSSLGNCSQLQALLLYSNMLEEGIPSEIGKLQKLKVLDISRNSLSGSIPPQLGNCSELSVLVLSNLFQVNNTYGNSPLDGMSNEISTDEYNFFQGEIPEGISILPKLRILWAPRAILEGRFPSNWGRCDSLEVINLAQNLLSGELPRGLSQCKKLQFLDLSSNRLSGPLNQDLPVPCMTFSDISGNKMVGPIPVFSKNPCPPVSYSLNKFSFESDDPFSQYLWFFATRAQASNKLPTGDGDSLVVFHNFGQNKFSGSLQSLAIAPERLGKQTVYAYLAGGNKLTGPFPRILLKNCGGLKALIVNVSNNKISGPIPGEIGEMCASLKILDASENQINGSIPSSFGKLSLDVINLSWNLLQSGIPFSLGRIATLKYLSLAHNNLKGPIPSSLGQLHVLQSLDLSSNSLTGEIPQDVVKLRSLTLLLLNNNKLSGQIPDGLANVITLSSFNVSFNNLSGSLPSNNNLMKCSSVLGNPLLQPCRMFSLTVPSSDLASSNLSASPSNDPTPSSGNGSGMNSIEIASITSASAIVSVLLALIVLFIYSRKWKPRSKIHGSSKKEVIVFTDIGVQLTFENVVQATNNFNASNCIGSGGFGATYKAEISPGVVVAIKRLSVGRFQGVQQFRTEVKTLGRLRHPNLVTLIGYHASETEMFLIYNFLPRGNLEKFIRERSTRAIDWRILHKIAFDIAQALTYLHDECIPRVLHRDVKPSNILIDDDFNAYLSDFGLARLLGTSETHATTGVAGTFGYVAPEYAMTCRVSDKADVYSYGVVLLELLSDKKALDPSFSSYGNGFNIVALACMLLRQGRAKEFFTAGLWEVGPHDDLVEMLHLAVVCTVDSLSYRPTMKQVVRRLKQLQPPSC